MCYLRLPGMEGGSFISCYEKQEFLELAIITYYLRITWDGKKDFL